MPDLHCGVGVHCPQEQQHIRSQPHGELSFEKSTGDHNGGSVTPVESHVEMFGEPLWRPYYWWKHKTMDISGILEIVKNPRQLTTISSIFPESQK